MREITFKEKKATHLCYPKLGSKTPVTHNAGYENLKIGFFKGDYLAAYTLGLMATQHYEPLHKKHWLYTVRRYHNLDTPILGKLKAISLRHPSVEVPDAEKEKGFFTGFLSRRSEKARLYRDREWGKDPKTKLIPSLTEFKKNCDAMPEKFRDKQLIGFDGEFPAWKEGDTYNGETAQQLTQYLRDHPDLKLYTNLTVREFILRAAINGHADLLKELIEHGTGFIPPECPDAADQYPELQEYLDEKGAW